MEICFPDAETRDLYNCREALIKAWGTRLCDLVCCRLSILQAAHTLSLVPTSPPIGLVSRPGSAATYSVALGRDHVLRFHADQGESTNLEPSEVTRILVIGVHETTPRKGRK